jgi:shikimate kinase
VNPRRIVLWGFMASGKTVVGGALARRLGWEHVDLDAEIVRRAGCSIAEVFRTRGEPAFRRLEAEVTAAQIAREGVVLSPGGGWVTHPDHLRQLPTGTLTVWLRVRPESVLERVRADRSGIERPLLDTPDPAAAVRRLLAEREPLYAAAELTLDTDGASIDALVDRLEAEIRARSPDAS